MSIYATGTSGYVGSKLRNSTPIHIDLTHPKTFTELTIPPGSTIIHLAAIVGVHQVLKDPVLAYKVNVEGTLQFAEYIRNETDARFIYVSSSHVYRESNTKHTEASTVEPKSLYAKQKLEVEEYLKESNKNAQERLLIARVFSILGRDMPQGTLGWAIEQANLEAPIKNCDDLRDFSTAEEIGEKLEQLARTSWLTTTLNVCSGTCRKVRDAGEALRKELKLSTEEGIFLSGNSTVPQICGDNSLLVKTLSRVANSN